jgi:TonB-linked SusC/RagA family outer membrane protein
MNKTLRQSPPVNRQELYKHFLAMKVFLMLMLFSVIQLHAEVYSQNQRIHLDLRDSPVYEAVEQIAMQSDLLFLYNEDEYEGTDRITLRLKNATLDQAMQSVLKGSSLEYEVVDNYLVLKPVVEVPQKAVREPDEPELITGVVTDKSDGTPLPGVNVYIKGTVIGTITDIDGTYSLEVTGKDQVLVFSQVGMKTVEIRIGKERTINVGLEQDQIGLDEVVVIGYGQESRKLLTGSVSDLQMEDIEETAVTNLDAAMQGRVTGVQVVQNSGTPGSGISVRIRGNKSIGASTQPLYVIDGVPIMTGDFGQIGFSGQSLNAISDINPNDIESVTVLKDASATAIYGARASGGVVLITTKKGTQMKSQLNFTASYGFQQVIKKLEMLDAAQWMRYRNELKINEGAPPIYSEDEINNPKYDTRWLDEVFRTGNLSKYELSYSGGTKKTSIFLSGNYMNDVGILIGTDYSRMSGRMNIEHQATDWAKIGANIMISNSVNNRVEGDQSLNGPLPNAISLPAIYPVFNEDGSYNEDGPYANPVAIANEAINEAQNFRSIVNINGTFRIWRGLSFETKWALDYLNLEEHSYDPATTRQGQKYNGLGYEGNTRASTFNTYNLLRYTQTIGDNDELEALLGYSYERFADKRFLIRGTDYPGPQFQYIISAASITDGSSSIVEDRTNSFFGRVKYNMRNTYLFTASLRYDGSSNFGNNKKYGFFPAFAAAWRISQEPFFENVNAVEEFKLRASFGYTGNDKVGRYASMGLFDGRGNYDRNPGIYPVQMPNPDLKWETTRQLDVGIDMAFISGRIGFTLDYYYSKTNDLLLARPLPVSSGFGSVWENIGEMQNQGVELGLNAEIIKSPSFTWNAMLNISANRNKVLKLYNGQPIDPTGRGNNYVTEGEPMSIFWGYRSLGVDPSTGDIVFDDVNGDGVITADDRTRIGDPNPDFVGGFDNSFQYKQLSLRIFFQYSYGNDIYNGTRVYIESLKGEDNQLTTIEERWKQPGDETYIPRATSTDPNNNNRASSRFIEDGSYLRMKEATLTYEFKPETLSKTPLKRLKLFVTGGNLLTFTNYSGMDPEINYAGDAIIRSGTDFFTYPQPRRVIFGINIGL